MGQASQIGGKLKNSDFIIKKSVKKTLNAFFSKYTFLKLRARLLLDFSTDWLEILTRSFFVHSLGNYVGFFKILKSFFAIDIYLR